MGKNTAARAPRTRRSAKSATDTEATTTTTTVIVDSDDKIVAVESSTAAPTLTSVPRADEFTVDHGAFKRALARITSVVDKRSTLPILANVAIRSRGETLEMVGTDLNVWLTLTLATGKGSATGGTTTPAHKLCALVKTMPPGEVAIVPSGAHASIVVGSVSARVTTIPDRDYPKIPTIGDAPWTSADATALRNAIDSVLFSVCRDETRFHLNGALMECDGTTLTLVTTDGHRLTKARESWTWSGPSLVKGILIPAKGLTELRKLLTGVSTFELGIAGPYLFARTDGATLAVKLTDAQFPPYEQVIPKDNRTLVTVDRKALVEALKRSKLIASGTRGARIEVTEGSLVIATDDPDQGDVRDPIPSDYTGKTRRWGVNPTYLLELLGEMSDVSITMAFKDELDPCLIRSTDDAAMRPISQARFLGVIMPMRI